MPGDNHVIKPFFAFTSELDIRRSDLAIADFETRSLFGIPATGTTLLYSTSGWETGGTATFAKRYDKHLRLDLDATILFVRINSSHSLLCVLDEADGVVCVRSMMETGFESTRDGDVYLRCREGRAPISFTRPIVLGPASGFTGLADLVVALRAGLKERARSGRLGEHPIYLLTPEEEDAFPIVFEHGMDEATFTDLMAGIVELCKTRDNRARIGFATTIAPEDRESDWNRFFAEGYVACEFIHEHGVLAAELLHRHYRPRGFCLRPVNAKPEKRRIERAVRAICDPSAIERARIVERFTAHCEGALAREDRGLSRFILDRVGIAPLA